MSYTNWETELLATAINKAVGQKSSQAKKVKNLKQKQRRNSTEGTESANSH